MEARYVAVAGGLVVLLLLVLYRRRRSSGARASERAHNQAQERDPPVELGGTYEFGVTSFNRGHTSADAVFVESV